MRQHPMRRAVALFAAVTTLFATFALSAPLAAVADVPTPAVSTPFQAPLCAGDTDSDPADQQGVIVPDATLVFGQRLAAYNAGRIVPLYDAFGGTVLIDSAGTVRPNAASYPPLCGTRYIESAGTAVSEWMFCTDRDAQPCGDTDAAGNLVDGTGTILNPMTSLAGNPKLDAAQEKLIAYLIQHGHSYAGVGDQLWGGVIEARADGTTDTRNALQTLVWCISDPATSPSDFATTCENNLPATEQARLLALIPDAPELVLGVGASAGEVPLGTGPIEYRLRTNVYNQPITIATGGTAGAAWSVCAGDASLVGGTLVVHATDPTASSTIVLCAEATAVGTATVNLSVSPPSTEHIGWSQSQNPGLTPPCQVYATFHSVDMLVLTASADARFVAAPAPGPNPGGGDPGDGDPGGENNGNTGAGGTLAASGGEVSAGALALALGALLAGAALIAARRRASV